MRLSQYDPTAINPATAASIPFEWDTLFSMLSGATLTLEGMCSEREILCYGISGGNLDGSILSFEGGGVFRIIPKMTNIKLREATLSEEQCLNSQYLHYVHPTLLSQVASLWLVIESTEGIWQIWGANVVLMTKDVIDKYPINVYTHYIWAVNARELWHDGPSVEEYLENKY